MSTQPIVINPDTFLAKLGNGRALVSARMAGKLALWKEKPWTKGGARLLCAWCVLGKHRSCSCNRCACEGKFRLAQP